MKSVGRTSIKINLTEGGVVTPQSLQRGRGGGGRCALRNPYWCSDQVCEYPYAILYVVVKCILVVGPAKNLLYATQYTFPD